MFKYSCLHLPPPIPPTPGFNWVFKSPESWSAFHWNEDEVKKLDYQELRVIYSKMNTYLLLIDANGHKYKQSHTPCYIILITKCFWWCGNSMGNTNTLRKSPHVSVLPTVGQALHPLPPYSFPLINIGRIFNIPRSKPTKLMCKRISIVKKHLT